MYIFPQCSTIKNNVGNNFTKIDKIPEPIFVKIKKSSVRNIYFYNYSCVVLLDTRRNNILC